MAALVRDADEILIVLTGATSFKSFQDISGDPIAATAQTLARTHQRSYKDLRDVHREDYTALYNRVALNLGIRSHQQPPDR
jgi:alpha-L-fucosidase 2